MTDRSTYELGPAARRQLEGIIAQTAGGLLAVALEAAGLPPDDRWQLTIERATLTRNQEPASNGAPHSTPSLNASPATPATG